jgi:hypothetical protein
MVYRHNKNIRAATWCSGILKSLLFQRFFSFALALNRFSIPFFKIMILRMYKDLERDGCDHFEGTLLERQRRNRDNFIRIPSKGTDPDSDCARYGCSVLHCIKLLCFLSMLATRLGEIFMKGAIQADSASEICLSTPHSQVIKEQRLNCHRFCYVYICVYLSTCFINFTF